jgi:hypothetical protein
MIELEIRLNGLELEDDDEAIYNSALFELSKCEPITIESHLADEGQMIDNVDEKINALTENLIGFQATVMSRLDDMQAQISNNYKPRKEDIAKKNMKMKEN